MDKALLDTDMLSEVLKGRHPGVASRAEDYLTLHGSFTISAIAIVEIVKGFQKVGREDKIQRFLNLIQSTKICDLDAPAAEIAGRIYGSLERAGQTIGRADPLIAGIAIRNDCVLVTGNMRHFQRIIDLGFNLRIVSWKL